MQGGELGAGEGAVGYDAVDEGLVDGGAEEGAVAGRLVSMDEGGSCWERGFGVPEDVVGSWAPEDGDVRHCGESLDGEMDGG